MTPRKKPTPRTASKLAFLHMRKQIASLKYACAKAIAPWLKQRIQGSDAEHLINTMRGGATFGCCFGNTNFYDPNPYYMALNITYPGFAGNPGRLLHDALDRRSTPMMMAALIAGRDALAFLLSRLTAQEIDAMFYMLASVSRDRDMKHLIRTEEEIANSDDW